MTDLSRTERSPLRSHHRHRTYWDSADRIGIAIAVAAAVLAVALAVTEIVGEGPADLPLLTPLAEGHGWSGFSA